MRMSYSSVYSGLFKACTRSAASIVKSEKLPTAFNVFPSIGPSTSAVMVPNCMTPLLSVTKL